MGTVDSPDPASQFIETLTERQNQADSPGMFAGPLDYWITWIAGLISVIALVKWPRKKNN